MKIMLTFFFFFAYYRIETYGNVCKLSGKTSNFQRLKRLAKGYIWFGLSMCTFMIVSGGHRQVEYYGLFNGVVICFSFFYGSKKLTGVLKGNAMATNKSAGGGKSKLEVQAMAVSILI